MSAPLSFTEQTIPQKLMVEFSLTPLFQIVFAMLSQAVHGGRPASIIAFVPNTRFRIFFRILDWLGRMNLGPMSLYRSFGAKELLVPALSKDQRALARQQFDMMTIQAGSKESLLALRVNGLLVGDLIYDEYLRRHSTPTVQIGSPRLRKLLLGFAEDLVFWTDFFRENNPSFVFGTHNIYRSAIPLRLAKERGYPSYFGDAYTGIEAVDLDFESTWAKKASYRKTFKILDERIRTDGLRWAEQQIEARLSGEFVRGVSEKASVAMQALATLDANDWFPGRKEGSPLVFLALHSLFDSPHVNGKHLFPDFWEWMSFLSDLSKKTDYQWLVKQHPDDLAGSEKYFQEFMGRNPDFIEVPPNVPHAKLIRLGIDCVLTMYGTVGLDFALLGTPTINASENNPHFEYGFNLHPRSLDEYRRLILDIPTIISEIDKDEIKEFYFMHHGYRVRHLFFSDFQKIATESGHGFNDFGYSAKLFELWLEDFHLRKGSQRIDQISRFIGSGQKFPTVENIAVPGVWKKNTR